MKKHTLWYLIGFLAVGNAVASEETAIEVAQPIVTEDAIELSRVTFVTHSEMFWGGLVDYTCEVNCTATDSDKTENRNAASLAGIKTWVDPYHFQEQELRGDTVCVYVDLTKLDVSQLTLEESDVVAATIECVLVNATASMTGWSHTANSEVAAKHLHVEVRGAPEFSRLTRTYRFKDLVGKVPRTTRFGQ